MKKVKKLRGFGVFPRNLGVFPRNLGVYEAWCLLLNALQDLGVAYITSPENLTKHVPTGKVDLTVRIMSTYLCLRAMRKVLCNKASVGWPFKVLPGC